MNYTIDDIIEEARRLYRQSKSTKDFKSTTISLNDSELYLTMITRLKEIKDREERACLDDN